MSLLVTLPHHLRVSIVILVARSGGTHLDLLIASGKSGMELAFHPDVLREALLFYLLQPQLANEGSKFRPFILRCTLAGNQTTCYLESLKLAVKDGLLAKSINLLANIKSPSPRLSFALAPTMLCRSSNRRKFLHEFV